MIFRQSLKQEFTQSAVGVFLTLLSITMTVYLVQLLNRAATGRIEAETVGPSLVFMVIRFVPTLLALTIFIAVLTTLSRSVRDSEMIIWRTAGMPLSGFIPPVLQFSLPVVVIIALLSTLLSPFASQQDIRYQEMFKRRSDVSRVSPGHFRESATKNRVFFVESFDEQSQTIRNIFVHTPTRDGGLRVISAHRAEVEQSPTGQRFVVLKDGRAYDGITGKADFSVMTFERYLIAVGTTDPIEPDLPTRAKDTTDLVADPTGKNLSELLWRVHIPLLALVLSVMAIPLSIYNPRTNQSANLIFALLTFIVYSNILSLCRTMASQGKLSFWQASFAVHGLVVLIVFGFFLLTKLYRWYFK